MRLTLKMTHYSDCYNISLKIKTYSDSDELQFDEMQVRVSFQFLVRVLTNTIEFKKVCLHGICPFSLLFTLFGQ